MQILPIMQHDGYKSDHRRQYPSDTTRVYSNLTPRRGRRGDAAGVIWFGLQFFVQEYLIRQFNRNFFEAPRDAVLSTYKRRMDAYLGPDAISTDHIRELHDLGYLPLRIKSLPEGEFVPYGVPTLTVVNTDERFFWLTNMLETLMSSVLWKASTSATTAFMFRRVFEDYAKLTGADPGFIPWQGHDFSFRGMCGVEDAAISGAAHLLSFTGTDTIPAIDFLEMYYGADCDKELIGGSVAATEHSVMCMGEPEGELDTFNRLLTQTYPTGILSVVSDTWDLWKVLTEHLPELKETILAREGKLVIRPDSGDPVQIVCGTKFRGDDPLPSEKGVAELLWDTFGGKINNAGYRELDPHVGIIYGDGISPKRQVEMLQGLADKGFASSNIVLGMGSFCVSPETPVLCADLIWRKAGDLAVDQEIIAFDENPEFGDGRHAARCYQLARVTANNPAMKPCARVYTDLGSPVTASEDHPWLVWEEHRNRSNVYVGGILGIPDGMDPAQIPRTAGLAWKQTSELSPGDQIAFLSQPWEHEETRSAGWLEGMFDGEGCLSRSSGDDRIPAWKINISQNAGTAMDRLRLELRDRGFDFYENRRECGQLVLTGGWTEVLRFLGTIRPERLLEKLPKVVAQMPALKRNFTYQLATVTAVEKAGMESVASISTSTGTFITNGYLSHNTYQYVTRDTDGWAMKATAGWTRSRGFVPIFKDPVTDDGTKKSAFGLLCVTKGPKGYELEQNVTEERENQGELQVVFEDGVPSNPQTLAQIRARVETNL